MSLLMQRCDELFASIRNVRTIVLMSNNVLLHDQRALGLLQPQLKPIRVSTSRIVILLSVPLGLLGLLALDHSFSLG